MPEFDKNEVLRDALTGLNEEVPPMPETLHAAWMQKVEDDTMEKNRTWKSVTRFLSIAAALVFVVGGTLLTRDDLALQSDSLTEAGSAKSITTNGARQAVTGSYDYGAAYANTYDASPVEEMAEDAEYESASPMMLARSTTADTAATVLADKKIIRTASLTIATQVFDESLEALTSACTGLGGWIESSSESLNSYSGLRTAYLTLRVPQDSLDSYLAGTESLGRITSRSESAQDVTASYQDTATRLETQLALMARLQALITESADLSDLLALEAQIADTQYQIDRLQSSLNSTDRQVSYSTVDVTLKEEKVAELTDTTVSFGERIVSAITVGFEALTDFLQDMVVFLVAALPFIAIAAVAFVIGRIVIRKRRK